MTAEMSISILSVVMTVLGVALTVVTTYLGYLAVTLESRILKKVGEQAIARHQKLSDVLDARLALVDVAVESLCSSEQGVRTEIYFLRHLSRLVSTDATEIDKALGALEAGGKEVQHLLPYVERLKNHSNWPSEAMSRFERLLRKVREEARSTTKKGS